ncbi:MAG TPA: TonB-dependent receptor plug domain-containing protein [Lacunisphaera sp.]
MTTNRTRPVKYTAALVSALLLGVGTSWAQQAATAPAPVKSADDDVIQLSPFEVSSSNTNGYAAATTLAGNRLNTQLRDIGNAVTVITSQFMKDIGATDNNTLLQYTTNTEVGSAYGNFAGNGDGATLDESPHFINPNQNTRVRGLTSADNTRDFFLTNIPWEGYNIDGVDLQRGPNSILFGQGSPAGIINARTKQAGFKDSNEVTFRVGSFGSNRATLDVNRVLIKDELALRIDAVRNDEEYKQDPAYSENNRAYGAIRWEPGFLKKGNARTIIKADLELGRVASNNPRDIPPIDKITPWFLTGTYAGQNVANQPFTYNNLNKLTLTPSQNEDDNTGLPNHGENRPSHNGPGNYPVGYSGTPNEFYNPWVGNFGNQFGNPSFIFNNNSATTLGAVNWEPTAYNSINTDGSHLGGGVLPFQRPAGVAGYATFAKNAKLPYADFGIYKDKVLTDPSIFDFYNQQLDGPNKHEWQNFRTWNISLAQTFFNDHLGFEANYHREWYKSGATSLLDGNGTQSIGIDMSSTLDDGSPNPNVGRPYLSSASQFGNQSEVANYTTKRLTIFGRHNFDEGERRNWFTKLLGEHTVTGLANEDLRTTDQRTWQLYGVGNDYINFINNPNKPKFTDNTLTPNTVIYLGPSLASASSASGAHLSAPSVAIVPTTGTVYTFDSTWNKSSNPADANYVNPAAFWHNPYYPVLNPVSPDGLYKDANGNVLTPGNGIPGDSTQNQNPANYVGYRQVPVTVINSMASQANRDLETTSAALAREQLTSTAATWQGNFWGNALVATYGVRKDIDRTFAYSENVNGSSDLFGHLDLSPTGYNASKLVANPAEQIISHAWTAVLHLNELGALKKLPLQVSVFYNHSTDFQPAGARVDVYGEALAPPKGVTKDMGILLETKDGKYSLKINKYENTSTNASSTTLNGAWFIGSSQAWAGNWVNRFEFNWTGDTIGGAVAVNDPTNSEYNYGQAPGETLAQAQTREANAIAAYRTWQQSVDPRFYKAWGINLNDHTQSINATQPNGFTVTEDSVSKGYEIELSAVPVKNWRLTFNASKTNAQRSNIGGAALQGFIASYEKALKTTAAGDVRIWWGGAGNETSLQDWNANIGSEFAQRKLQQGTDVPELREWRFNAISNYDFDHGWLKGFNVGGGIRYESSIVIGYAPLPGATVNDISFDIANPYKGPADTNFDFWVGYSRRVWRNIDWSIQLNVRNAFVGNELVPITTEPDGTPAAYRIRPPQTWQLTNTFKF